jgi:hypothetical protein
MILAEAEKGRSSMVCRGGSLGGGARNRDRVWEVAKRAMVAGGFVVRGVEELSIMRERVGVVGNRARSGLWVWMGALWKTTSFAKGACGLRWANR